MAPTRACTSSSRVAQLVQKRTAVRKSPYEAFSFYYGEDLAERLRCHEVAAKDINLTARLLKK